MRSLRYDRRRGQAMTEFVIWVFVLLVMIAGIIWFGRATNLKIQCHYAARYSAWANAVSYETRLDESQIQARAQQYYPLQDNYEGSWTQMDPQSGFDTGSLSGSGGSGAGGMDFMGLVNGLFNFASNSKGYMVQANYNPGGLMNNVLPDGTHVRSLYVVSGGPWDKRQTRGDLMIMAAKGALMAWSTAALASM